MLPSSPFKLQAFTRNGETQGSPISSYSHEESICSVCNEAEAKLICCCDFPPVLVCKPCISLHLEKQPIGLHAPLPIQIRPNISSPAYITSLRNRYSGKIYASQLLSANLVKIAEAEREIQRVCQWILTSVQEARDAALQQLWEIRENIKAGVKNAIQEVEDHIYEEGYKPETTLSDLIWSFSPLRPSPISPLFSFSINPSPILDLLPSLIRLCPTPAPYSHTDNYLPIINSTSIRIFHYETEAIAPPIMLEMPIMIDATSAWLVLEEGKLFCCGRHHPASSAAYVLDVGSGGVAEVEGMQSARSQHGVVLYKNDIYVFGGLLEKTYLSSSEYYSLSLRHWFPIPNMLSPRDGFNPCTHSGLIYIVGGSNSTSAEIYHPEKQCFTPLDLILPKADCSISLFLNEELYILQRSAMYRWTLQAGKGELRVEQLKGSATWSNVVPRVAGNCVYILNCWTHTIGKCDLGTLDFHQAHFVY